MMDETRIERALRAGPPDEGMYVPRIAKIDHARALSEEQALAGRAVVLRERPRLSFRASIAAAVAVVLIAGALLLRPSLHLPDDQPGLSPMPSESPSPAPTPPPSSVDFPGSRLIELTANWSEEAGAFPRERYDRVSVAQHGRIWGAGSGLSPAIQVFQLGPLSRTYVVGVVLQLVDQGKVGLDDRLGRFVRDWPNGDAITIRQLLTGSSGVASFGDPVSALADRVAADPGKAWSPADALLIARSKTQRFPPGTRIAPIDTEDALLAEVIRSVTASDAASEIRRRFLDPIALKATYLYADPIPTPGSGSPGGAGHGTPEMTRGHWDAGGSKTIDGLPPGLLQVLGPGRGTAASADDAARYLDVLRTDPATLSDAAREQLSVAAEDGGFGGVTLCPCGTSTGEAIGTAGTSGAYSAIAAYFPAEQLTIVVLVDRPVSNADLKDVVGRIYDLTAPAFR